MVTAEIAVALPSLLIVCALLVGVAQAGQTAVRACDLARQAARAAAIGEQVPAAGTGLTVHTRSEDGWVHAHATATLGGWDLPGPVTCNAHALAEVAP